MPGMFSRINVYLSRYKNIYKICIKNIDEITTHTYKTGHISRMRYGTLPIKSTYLTRPNNRL